MSGWIQTTRVELESMCAEFGGFIEFDNEESIATWPRGGVTYWAPLPVVGGDS